MDEVALRLARFPSRGADGIMQLRVALLGHSSTDINKFWQALAVDMDIASDGDSSGDMDDVPDVHVTLDKRVLTAGRMRQSADSVLDGYHVLVLLTSDLVRRGDIVNWLHRSQSAALLPILWVVPVPSWQPIYRVGGEYRMSYYDPYATVRDHRQYHQVHLGERSCRDVLDMIAHDIHLLDSGHIPRHSWHRA